MKNSTFIFFFGVLFSVSCSKEHNLPENSPGMAYEFVAGFDETKTIIDETLLHIMWQPDDSISVLFDGQNSKFISDAHQNERRCIFHGGIDLSSSTSPSDKVWAVYPYMSATRLDENKLKLTLKPNQNAYASSFDPEALITVACCGVSEKELYFKHLCGGLRFKLKDEGVKNVSFRSHNDSPLAGTMEVSIKDDGTPVISNVLDSRTSVSLECPGGFKTDTWYYLIMLPSALEKGFSITLHRDDCSMTYYSNKATAVKRAVFGQLSQLDKGLIFENDWIVNDFVHRSLLLLLPQCYFPSFITSSMQTPYLEALTAADGELEIAQMFPDGPSPTPDINNLIKQIGCTYLPFGSIDYREPYTDGPAVVFASRETARLYGTSSGISINSEFSSDELRIETTLYFKKAGTYRIVVLVTENYASYPIYYNNDVEDDYVNMNCLTRNVVSNITGDPISVLSDNTVKYREYVTSLNPTVKKNDSCVLVYIIKEEGGEWHVDNAFSAKAGHRAGLPLKINCDSTIEPLENYEI